MSPILFHGTRSGGSAARAFRSSPVPVQPAVIASTAPSATTQLEGHMDGNERTVDRGGI